MSTTSTDITEFYQQLGLLLRARLPLPAALSKLAANFAKKDFRSVLEQISQHTANGETFSLVLRQYRTFFSPLEIQLIAAGEASGTLPEVLFTVARFARFNQIMTQKVRSILAYPLVTLHLGLIAFLYVAIEIIPEFTAMLYEMAGPKNFSWSSRTIMALSTFLSEHRQTVLPLYMAFVGFCIWLCGPWLAAEKLLLSIIRRLPLSCGVVSSLDSARLCRIWAAFLKQRIPIHGAFRMSADLVEQPHVTRALTRAADAVEGGRKPGDVLAGESAIDRSISLTFQHAAEENIGVEIEGLAEVYEHRVMLTTRAATALWSTLALIAVSITIGMIVTAMFKPLTTIVHYMSY